MIVRYPAPVSSGTSLRNPNAEPKRPRSEEHTSELQSLAYLVCRLLLEKKKTIDEWEECYQELQGAWIERCFPAVWAHAVAWVLPPNGGGCVILTQWLVCTTLC